MTHTLKSWLNHLNISWYLHIFTQPQSRPICTDQGSFQVCLSWVQADSQKPLWGRLALGPTHLGLVPSDLSLSQQCQAPLLPWKITKQGHFLHRALCRGDAEYLTFHLGKLDKVSRKKQEDVASLPLCNKDEKGEKEEGRKGRRKKGKGEEVG